MKHAFIALATLLFIAGCAPATISSLKDPQKVYFYKEAWIVDQPILQTYREYRDGIEEHFTIVWIVGTNTHGNFYGESADITVAAGNGIKHVYMELQKLKENETAVEVYTYHDTSWKFGKIRNKAHPNKWRDLTVTKTQNENIYHSESL